MNTSRPLTTAAAIAAAAALALSGCAAPDGGQSTRPSQDQDQSESASAPESPSASASEPEPDSTANDNHQKSHGDRHDHAADGGQPPKGITKASGPRFAVGDEVVLAADHMPGMKGAKATIDASTDDTVYMVDVDTGDMTMTNHKWVVDDEVEPAK